MALAYVQTAGNGSNRLFSVPFPFLLRAHVKVFLNYDVVTGTGTELVDGTSFSWLSNTQIQTTAAPALGTTVTVIRKTPSGAQLVVYAPGSPPTPTDLNTADLQALYVIQEQADLTTATAALASNNAAAVASVLPYQPVVAVANIPSPPLTNGQRIEIGNSTGIESYSPLTGRPSGFVGASTLTARLVYTTTGNAWQWVDYRATDPDSRYAGVNFTQPGTGAVGRTVTSKLSDVVNVKDFGAVGDGVADDTAAIQNAVNEAMKYGKQVLIQGPGPYYISSTIQVKVTRDLAPTDVTPASDVHFTDNTSAFILGLGTPTLKAIGSMTAMMELIFDTSDSDIGPFYSKVESIGFDGNSLATAGIKSNYSMHVTIERNRFWNLVKGIEYTGYGVANIKANTFKCLYGIYFVAGGGDTLIVANDFYSPESGTNSAGIYMGYYSGDVRIFSNVFTNEFSAGLVTLGIQMAGGAAAGSEEIRDIAIRDNEFCGMSTAIRADGKSSSIKNIYRIKIDGNHTLPYGANNPGSLLAAVDCVQLQVSNNFCNAAALSDATSIGVELVRCLQAKLHSNKFSNYASQALSMTNCVDTEIISNTFTDCGKLGTSYVVASIFGSSSLRNHFRLNYFRQNSSSYGQYGILEDTGVDYTFSSDNIFENLLRPHTKVGANSVMRRIEYKSAIPTTGSYYAGDTVWNTAPAAGGAPGWVCTTSGVSTFVFKAMANLAP